MLTSACIIGMTGVAYALFFLYDWVTVCRAEARNSQFLFLVALALNAAAAVLLCVAQLPALRWDALAVAASLGAAASLFLLVRALFFSLPKDTYANPELGRRCYTGGLYAICRHPGVLFYCLLFAFAALVFRNATATLCCAVLCVGDIAYMILQDVWTFPRTFCNYADYQRTTPLFLPTPASLRRAFAGTEGGCA